MIPRSNLSEPYLKAAQDTFETLETEIIDQSPWKFEHFVADEKEAKDKIYAK